MAEDVLMSKKITTESVAAALESLQTRGADLNPYSLAEELQVDASSIVGDGDVMQMLSTARGDKEGIVAAEYNKVLERVAELEGEKAAWLACKDDSQISAAEQLERLEAENTLLKELKVSLELRVNQLEETRQEAWQQGKESAEEAFDALLVLAREDSFQQGKESAEKTAGESLEIALKEARQQAGASAASEFEATLADARQEAWQKGKEAARREFESLLESCTEEAFQKGYESGKQEATEHEGTQAESYQKGFAEGRAEMQDILKRVAQEAWQQGFDEGRQPLEAPEFFESTVGDGIAGDGVMPALPDADGIGVVDTESTRELTGFIAGEQEESTDDVLPAQAGDSFDISDPALDRQLVLNLADALSLQPQGDRQEYQLPEYLAPGFFAEQDTAGSAAGEAGEPGYVAGADSDAQDGSVFAPDTAAVFDADADTAQDVAQTVSDVASESYVNYQAPADDEPGVAGGADSFEQPAVWDQTTSFEQPAVFNQSYAYESAAAVEPDPLYDADLSSLPGSENWQDSAQAFVDAPAPVAANELDVDSVAAFFNAAISPDEASTHDTVQLEKPEPKQSEGAPPPGFKTGNKSKTAFDPNELRNLVQHRLQKQEETVSDGDLSAKTKFVGGKHSGSTMEHTVPERPKAVLPDIRRACQLLGLRPEDLSLKSVLEAWKHEMSKPGVHPDTGGDPQMAASLNNAKDLLTSYLEGQVPKLGKIFKTKAPERGRKEDARDDGA